MIELEESLDALDANDSNERVTLTPIHPAVVEAAVKSGLTCHHPSSESLKAEPGRLGVLGSRVSTEHNLALLERDAPRSFLVGAFP